VIIAKEQHQILVIIAKEEEQDKKHTQERVS